jgi:phage/plasmid-like protein (TIGR03299 family)
MAHELEQNTTADGTVVTSFAAAKRPGWHGLGTVTPGLMTAEELMDTAHLGGWDVRALPSVSHVELDNGTVLPLVDHSERTVVRTNPFTGQLEKLGTVGSWYTPIQNEEHATYLQTLVAEGGATLETGGSLDGGRRVFITAKLPTSVQVGGVDRVDLYVACLNSHDGSSAFTTVVTPVRVVCANTERAALRCNDGVYKVRHTAQATQQIAEARRHLGLTSEWFEEFETTAERMVNTPMTTGEFTVLAKQIIRPGGDAGLTDRAKANDTAKLDHLVALLEDGSQQAEIRGTRWAGYNVITEHLDWHARVQTRNYADPAQARAARALVGGSDDVKGAAWKLFQPA